MKQTPPSPRDNRQPASAAGLRAAQGSAARSKMRVNNLFLVRHRKEMRGMKHAEAALLKSAFGIMGAR